MKINTNFFLVLSFIALMAVEVSCQELKRKAQLGVVASPMEDSIAERLSLEKGKGLYVRQVVPNSTVSVVGMEEGDVIYKINDGEVNSIPELFAQIAEIRAGDLIEFEFIQNGKRLTKTAQAIEKPKEAYANANVYYESISFGGKVSRSILYTPKNVENPPVVFYLQGYTCGSIDVAGQEFNPILKLTKQWVDAGYAVFRVEKPGVGDSQSDKPCSELNFNEEVEAFRQAYLALRADERIDANNIFLFGHSMGGVVAPILAKEFKPKGVITFGITVNSWFEYLLELTRVQGEMFHTPYAQIEDNYRRSLPFWYALLVEQQSNEAILKNEQLKTLLEEDGILEQFKNGQYMGRHYTFWSSLNQISLYNTWSEIESKVLALYGEFDIQALNANHIVTIANIVNASHPGNGDYKVVPNTDHGFIHFDSMEENVQTLNSGRYLEVVKENYNPSTAQVTIDWMNQCR